MVINSATEAGIRKMLGQRPTIDIMERLKENVASLLAQIVFSNFLDTLTLAQIFISKILLTHD